MTHLRPERHGLYDPANEHDACGVGFVAHVKGVPSHQTVEDAASMLECMDHRGAYGCEMNTGDGAGMLTGMPDSFMRRVAKESLSVELPEAGSYAVGNVFLPTDEALAQKCREVFAQHLVSADLSLVGWREVPHDPQRANLGPTALRSMPRIEQIFVSAADGQEEMAFERALYMVRKRVSEEVRQKHQLSGGEFYVCSLAPRLIIYKGMLAPFQVTAFYPDLRDDDYESHLAMVHSRFSTNTFPSWERAQPNRMMAHNGEINTLRGNVNWMHAREGVLESETFGENLKSLYPIVEPDLSDSGSFDNVLEFLVMTGRSLPEAAMMMVPEAWENHPHMAPGKRDFYEYHSCLMEPWDGPASITFTDGRSIGAILDRNGLRPSRYYLTHDDRVIMASEVGTVPVEPDLVKVKGRLEPGKMFLIDFEKGKLVPDDVVKLQMASARPYGEWLEQERIELKELPMSHTPHRFERATLIERLRAFGYTTETVAFMLIPLIQSKRDPIGSMGNDAALAVLSDRPRMLYDYFRQLFAQVTNPPIDSIREEAIMSLECTIGPEGNLLETKPEHAHRLRVPQPILTNEEMSALKYIDHRGWRSKVVDITWPRNEGKEGLKVALERIAREVEDAIDAGFSIAILSDRATGPDRVAVPSLLACALVHHHLIRETKRTRIGLIVESGEAREVHHHCLLLGFGADAINPYLAFDALWQAQLDNMLEGQDFDSRTKLSINYRKAVAKGILKVMGKMGISTLRSYKGAQIFEAIGLSQEVVDLAFTGTASRIEGVGLDVLADESLRRHALGYPTRDTGGAAVLHNMGEFHWRSGGERHMWDPTAIADIQLAAKSNDKSAYWRFAEHVDQESTRHCALRGLLDFKFLSKPIDIDEVEPAAEIVKRFCTGAMSFGSISAESHESLAIAMNRLGGKSNTGEGGEDSIRYVPLPNGDSKRSAIKQVASGRFGVTIWYLANADEIQIKIAQGAKPGEGGELPGRKVDSNIARIRHSTPGVGLISPPPHHDIYSIEDLKQLIEDLKNANPEARISVKLVSEVGVGTIAAGVAKAFAEHIVVSGASGGTGASPLTSIKHAGLPWELGVAETHQTLVLNDLRSRVVVQTDGQLKTGKDVAIAALLGAEEFGFATAPLVTLGCIMMRKCHLNTCPVGIATQDPELRKKFRGKPEYVVNYLFMVAEHVRQIMSKLGFRTINEMIGRVDVLESNKALTHWKSAGLDLSRLLTPAQKPHEDVDVYCTKKQAWDLENVADRELIQQLQESIEHSEPARLNVELTNLNRAFGTMLSHEIARRWGEHLLPEDTIHIRATGSAGQSLGAFLAKGVNIELEGDANDYVGKGLSGGKIIVYPPRESSFVAEDNIIAGNVCLYGATSGMVFIRGKVAERFCVRNSGAVAVVEGVGDHGCEYMTGGRAVILGPTGRNFAAGMSGGIAYVWDPHGDFKSKCNMGMVLLEAVEDDDDIAELLDFISMHYKYTGSSVAQKFLEKWPELLDQIVKVMPVDYKRVLMERQRHDEEIEAPVRSVPASA